MFDELINTVGNTPLVKLTKITGSENLTKGNIILGKLEGNNPAGSVKDRAAVSMISGAEKRGEIKPGDTLIEATSGNTGIALAMAAKMKGYNMRLIMPENLSVERRQVMRAFGAELILVSQSQGMEGARDLAKKLEKEGKGLVLDQFANDDNWIAHYTGTGPEIWRDSNNLVTHFISAMGTTGTITLNDVTVALVGSAADIKAALAGTFAAAYTGNVTINDADGTGIAATDITTIAGDTAGTVTISNNINITGTS